MTIRLRLTLWYTALLGTTLVLFSVIVYSALAANLWSQARQEATQKAQEVASTLTEQLQFRLLIIRNNPRNIQFPDLDFLSSSVGVQIIDLRGEILRRSDNVAKPVEVENYYQALEAVRAEQDHLFYTTDEKGMPLLVYSVPVVANESIWGAVQVIKSVKSVQDTLRQASRYLILGTALSLVLAALTGAFLARRALTPLNTITQMASTISRAKDLGQRLRITDDASEVGELAATFNNMLDRIQQLFNTQRRLIADVSHELRTPLTTIQGNVELLHRITSTKTQAESLEALWGSETVQEVIYEVESEAGRMNNMLQDLLLLAQADSGNLQLQQEVVEMDTLLLEVYRQTRRIAERRKGENALEIRLGSEDQASVLGDRERLRQLLLNLNDNAIKYTPHGGTITLSLQNSDNWVRISVEDTGIGISTEHQAQIFDRFYRTDKARSREQGGSGLGLSIAQSIAKMHNGYIEVSSTPHKGSTFTLWLPAI